jgi:hypothetical protein
MIRADTISRAYILDGNALDHKLVDAVHQLEAVSKQPGGIPFTDKDVKS